MSAVSPARAAAEASSTAIELAPIFYRHPQIAHPRMTLIRMIRPPIAKLRSGGPQRAALQRQASACCWSPELRRLTHSALRCTARRTEIQAFTAAR